MYKNIYVIIDDKGNFIRDEYNKKLFAYLLFKNAMNRCNKLKQQNKNNEYKVLRYVYEYLKINEVEF